MAFDILVELDLPSGNELGFSSYKEPFSLCGLQATITRMTPQAYILRFIGFKTEKDAEVAVLKIHNALAWFAIQRFRGLKTQIWIKSSGGAHGSGRGTLTVETSQNTFLELFEQGFNLPKIESPRTQSALEIFKAAGFEHSLNARFLLYITVLEILAQELQCKWNSNERELITRFVNEVKGHKALAERLNQLKKFSISSCLKKLIEKTYIHLGENPGNIQETVDIVMNLYNFRSRFVHDGELTLDGSPEGSFSRLQRITQRVLVACLENPGLLLKQEL